jgi:hypothetical protein
MKFAAAAVLLLALVSVASARPIGLRSVLSDKEDRYCEVDYDGEDECVTKYGKDLECKKLDKEKCVYEKECKYEDTDKCLKYNQERKCKQGKCTKYDKYGKCTKYAEDCKYVNTSCKEYKQEEVCKDVEVCWTGKCVPKKDYGYGRRLASAPKDEEYCEVDYDGEDECVTKYGKDLECKKLDKEKCVYEKECKYEDTDKCLKYNQERKCKQGKCTKYDKYGKCTKYAEDCKYVNTSCKEYKQEEVCKDVEVCWTGKCVPKKDYGYGRK